MIQIQIKDVTRTKNLPFRGIDNKGNFYSSNNQYLCKNDKPILPIMGEFHFSRWEESSWKEELQKMKSGGIQIVATYVFWIHHEEKEGEFDFTDNRSLRNFLECCKSVDINVWLRIGPWAHGECRNGGFPDWVLEKEYTPRTNNKNYINHVKIFFSQIANQARGFMLSDGGPVIGIQIENEYGHCGGPLDKEEGLKHLSILKNIIRKLGMNVPYYSATGWGGAYILENETLPVLAGYVDAPWAEHIKEMPANENFLFLKYRNDENVGSDLNNEKNTSYTYDINSYPYLTAELGAGLQVTSHRRTVPTPEDIESFILCTLGSGANLLGYYMYHGGINPDGKYSTLQESKETGYNNDLPIKSYDFQTCIKQSGEINESYGRLKKIHLFIKDFEEILAPSYPFFPLNRPTTAEDINTPRVSIRHNNKTNSGFLFINNHQRHRKMKAIINLTIEIIDSNKIIAKFENINVKSGHSLILPYNLKLGTGKLTKTNASLLCNLNNCYFFYTDKEPIYEWEGNKPLYITLSTDQANNAYKIKNTLYITNGVLFEENEKKVLLSKKEKEKIIYFDSKGNNTIKEINFKTTKIKCNFDIIEKNNKFTLYNVKINKFDVHSIHELYLEIDYEGDKAEVYCGKKLIDDWFTTGKSWHLALKRFKYPNTIQLKIYSYNENVYYDIPVKKGCILNNIKAIPEYKVYLE
jgi:hypothetical protein